MISVLLWSFPWFIAAVRNMESCFDQYLAHSAKLPATGCPKAADWSITNAETMHAGWRVFEVEFFEDIACTEKLKPIKIEGSAPMECDTIFEVRSAFDKLRSTLWVSGCGTESQCGFGQTTIIRTGALRPVPNACKPLEAYLYVSFEEPVAVNCVRVLQASGAFKADKIIVTAHLGQECYRCADGAIDVASPVNATNGNRTGTNTTSTTATPGSINETTTAVNKVCSHVGSADAYPCYDTLVGTPGLLARFYDDEDLLETYGDNDTVPWEDYDIIEEHMSLSINYQVAQAPMVMQIQNNTFVVRWTGYLRISTEGRYTFNILSAGRARFFLGNDSIIDNVPIQPSTAGGTHSEDKNRYLEVGMHELSIDYRPLFEDELAGIVLTWKGPAEDDQWEVIKHYNLMQRIMQASEETKATYVNFPDTQCYKSKMGSRFDTYTSARAKCDTLDDVCAAVYGKNCVNGIPTSSIDLCTITPGVDFETLLVASDENSCVLVKKLEGDETPAPTETPFENHAASIIGLHGLLWIVFAFT